MKNKIMTDILNLVKNEHKERLQAEIENMTEDFLKLTDTEKEEVYNTDGTVGYIFGSPRYESKVSDIRDIVINPKKDTLVVLNLIVDYLHYHID